MESIGEDEQSAAVVIATHNEASVVSAVSAMRELGVPPNHLNVHFAQILGMADHLTYALGLGTTASSESAPRNTQSSTVDGHKDCGSGDNVGVDVLDSHNVTKLLVYGDFDQVLPWMLRRLQENQDVLGAAARERSLLWRELWRRRFGFRFE